MWKANKGGVFEDFIGSSVGQGLVIGGIFLLIAVGVTLSILLPYLNRKQKAIYGTDDRYMYQPITVVAKLISKTENPVKNGIGTYASMVFEMNDGNRLEFKFPNLYNYSHMIVGDQGKLTYAGRAFINFERTI